MLNAPIGQDFEIASSGTHLGRCYRIVDIGTSRYEKFNKYIRKIIILFELSNLKMKDGKPFIVSLFCTLSLNRKSTLRKLLEQWRGKSFTDEEAESFDLMKLLSIPAQINIIHREKNGETYANIEAILPAVNMNCPQAVNEVFGFSLQDYTDESFGKLSEKLQKKIMASKEWQSGSVKEKGSAAEAKTQAGKENDVPYQPPF